MSQEDPYVYPGTDVLRNLRDIRDQEQLTAFELARSRQALADLRQFPVRGKFDLTHLQVVHSRIFGDVYPFAGEVRSIPLWKDEIVLSGGTVAYSQPAEIISDATKALAALRDGQWGDLTKTRHAVPFAQAVAEVWRAHPFREGNTRAVLVLIDQFCRSRDMAIDFSVISRIPSETRDALALATTGDAERLASIIAEARQSQVQRQHPVIGLMTSEAAEVMRLMGWPKVNEPQQGEIVRGQVLTTSYQTVLIHGGSGVSAVPLEAFPEPPETNRRVSITIPDSINPEEKFDQALAVRRDLGLEDRKIGANQKEWLMNPVRDWPQSVTEAATQQAASHPTLGELRRASVGEFAKVWRDPEVALDKVLRQAGPDGRISPDIVQKIETAPETLGPLRGEMTIIGKPDSVRAEALLNVVPALSMAEHMSQRRQILISDLGAAEQRRRDLLQQPLPSLSAKAHTLVKGVESALQLPEGSERSQRMQSALSDKGALQEVKSTFRDLRERFEDPRTRQVDHSRVQAVAQMVAPERATEIVRSVQSIEKAYAASKSHAVSGPAMRQRADQGYNLDNGPN